jgi:molybdopterin synthase catalytic subunit
MHVSVRLFASYREAAGRGTLNLEVPEGATLGAVAEALAGAYPALREPLGRAVIAVNQDVAPLDTPVRDGDEVAFLPPMSGGGPFVVTEQPLDADAVVAEVAGPAEGAVVVFIGTVRDNSRGGKPVSYLEYEAYAPMAERAMARIGHECRARFEVHGVAMHHRVGRLQLGEASVVIAVAAPHRGPAFEACRYAIDRLKETVPVWKKEVGPDGAYWVEEHS